MTDTLNHRVNVKWLRSRAEYYDRLARLYGLEPHYFFSKSGFCEQRGEVVRKEMDRILRVGQNVSCTVKGPNGIEYEIDGYPETSGYQGKYFKTFPIRIQITGKKHRASFSHWLINGKTTSVADLIYPLDSDTMIEPVFQ